MLAQEKELVLEHLDHLSKDVKELVAVQANLRHNQSIKIAHNKSHNNNLYDNKSALE